MIKLVDILKEIVSKEPKAFGSRHIIYPSQIHPDKIIKTAKTNPEYGGDEYNTLDLDSIELFQKHPDIFPIVYKVTDKYIVLEKLDDIKPSDELENLYNQVIKSNTEFSEYITDKFTGYDRGSDEFSTDIYEYITEEDKLPSDFNEVYSKIKDGELLKKYVSFIFKVIQLFSQHLDIHNEQFGYDSKGNLKLLDI
jgi:hypothetical protein